MTVSTPSSTLGRHVFGVAALAFGLITLAWHDDNDSHQLRYIVYAASAAQIFGGAAIQFRRTAKTGASVLGAAYLVFALLSVPRIVAAPQIYNSWGNFFEQVSFVTGAATYACNTMNVQKLTTELKESTLQPTDCPAISYNVFCFSGLSISIAGKNGELWA